MRDSQSTGSGTKFVANENHAQNERDAVVHFEFRVQLFHMLPHGARTYVQPSCNGLSREAIEGMSQDFELPIGQCQFACELLPLF